MQIIDPEIFIFHYSNQSLNNLGKKKFFMIRTPRCTYRAERFRFFTEYPETHFCNNNDMTCRFFDSLNCSETLALDTVH